jgi:hypothetical protein
MSSNQGGSPFSNMIQNFMMLNQVKAQREQQEIQRRQNMVSGLSTYMDQARAMPNPEQLTNLTQFYSETLGIDPSALDEIRNNIMPNIETMRTQAVRTGRDAMDPEQLAQVNQTAATNVLAGQTPREMGVDQFLIQTLSGEGAISDALRTRLAAGMSPGELRTSETLARQPDAFFDDMHNIAAGRQLSAGQSSQMELGWADHRQRERFHIAEMALREFGMELDQAGLQAKIAAGQDENALKEIEEYAKSVRSLTETRASRSQQEITAAEGLVNLQAQRLTEMGLLPPKWWLTEDGRYLDASQYDPAEARAAGWKPLGPRIDETARKNFFERRWR